MTVNVISNGDRVIVVAPDVRNVGRRGTVKTTGHGLCIVALDAVNGHAAATVVLHEEKLQREPEKGT